MRFIASSNEFYKYFLIITHISPFGLVQAKIFSVGLGIRHFPEILSPFTTLVSGCPIFQGRQPETNVVNGLKILSLKGSLVSFTASDYFFFYLYRF